MNLTPHFTLAELVRSQTAQRRVIVTLCLPPH